VNRGQGEIRDRQARFAADGPVVTVAAFVMLFLLGAVEGLIGTFQYSRGPAPLVAICLAAAILLTCVLGSFGMRSAAGAVLPALGWFVVTIVLSSVSNDGSVIITDTSAGKWFLFGGAICAAGGAVFGFARWSRTRS
jgi:Family of unknown function (DUF6113)